MKNANDPTVMTSPEYRQFIEDMKTRVVSARISAARAVSLELILLYWDIGRGIVEKQQVLGWGDAVVEMVAADLRRAFPQMTGFSTRNVWDMRRLYATYTALNFSRKPCEKLIMAEDVKFCDRLSQNWAETKNGHKQRPK